MMKGAISPSTSTPLQMWRTEESKVSHHGMEMAIVPSSTGAISPIPCFTVPEHWVVEDRQRRSGKTAGVVDRYYYEPETGLKFRSLKSIERYLADSEGKTPALKRHHGTIMARSTTTRTSSLKLPDGWVVEECIRTSGYSAGKVDKYYIEPGTGWKFRSLISVERHLAEVDGSPHTPKESKPENRIVLLRADSQELHQKQDMAIVAHASSTHRTSNFQRPVGRIVKDVPSSFPNYDDVIDEYYYEPGTGRPFRSLRAVERCLNEGIENTPTPKALKSGNSVTRTQKSGSQKKKASDLKKKNPSFKSTKPPVKIKWVLTDPGGDTWSPFVGESMVPDSVKQQWAKTFALSADYSNF